MPSYFARPGQLLSDHAQEVALGCALRAKKIDLYWTGLVLGIVHDWGKYSEDFVRYMDGIINETKRAARGSVDHSTAGAQFIWRNFPQPDTEAERVFRQIICLCGVSHHEGCLIDFLGPDGKAVFEERIAKEEESAHYGEVCEKVPADEREKVGKILNSVEFKKEVERFHEKLVQSNTDDSGLNKERLCFQYGLTARYLLSCLVDADHSSAAGTEKPESRKTPDWAGMLECLQEHLSTFVSRGAIDDMRSEIGAECLTQAERDIQLFLLTLPTGGGKTLSSLSFALAHARKHELDRIIYVIPYMSIIDQNAKVIQDALGKMYKGDILEHHSNVLLVPENKENDPVSLEAKREAYKKATDTWDVPIILTTAVQFLNTCFGKGFPEIRRFHSLSRSVIIFDEVQALPISSTYLFNGMVNFLNEDMGTSTVLCTATQPVLNKLEHSVGQLKMPEDHQIIRKYAEYYNEFEKLRKVNLQDLPESSEWDEEDYAQFIGETAREKGNTLVVVNTKSWARRLYQLCKSEEFEVYHLSTSMCPAHRKKIITEKINKKALNREGREKKVICISTQLIEAGVDVDFDVVIRSSSGLDSIVQAAGRCNRDSRRDQGEVIILHPSDKCERVSSLKEIKAGRENMQRVLSENDNEAQSLFSEESMMYYFRYYLHEFSEVMEYPVMVKDVGTSVMELLSDNPNARGGYERQKNRPHSDYLCQSFKSAAEAYHVIDNESVVLLTPYGRGRDIVEELNQTMKEEKKDWDSIRALLRESQQYSISLRNEESRLNDLKRSGIIMKSESDLDFYVLTPGYYDQDTGFFAKKSDSLIVANNEGYQI